MLIETDKTMEQLGKNFNSVKPENIKRVVMNSILILNKENFYTQLNQVLDKKQEDIALAKVEIDTELPEEEEEINEVREVKRLDGSSYFYQGGMKDDPFLNPEHYFLKSENFVPLDDLHIVFRSEQNKSDLIK